MRIFVNESIRHLFGWIGGALLGFSLLCAVAVNLQGRWAVWYVLASALCMSVLVFAALYRYFQTQDRVLEEAVTRIQAYLAGDPTARIPCDDEGELARLFHEVNSLVTILNAHAEQEGNAKRFLKDTISNISHQLKTPLAALNIYNGILQEEAGGLPTLLEFTQRSEQELDRMETLVQNLLKMAKWDSGTIVLEKTEELLSEIMDGVEQHFAYQVQRQGKNLICSGDDTVKLLCD